MANHETEINSTVYDNRHAGVDLEDIFGSATTTRPKGISKLQEYYISAAVLALITPNGIYRYYKAKTEAGDPEGLDWMIERLFRACEIIQDVRVRAKPYPELHKQLTAPVERVREPGKHDEDNVPPSNDIEIPSTGTPTLWALPRLLIMLEEKTGDYGEMLDNAIGESKSPVELLCNVSEAMHVKAGIPEGKIMGLLLKTQILKDQNNLEMYFDIITHLEEGEFTLWEDAVASYTARDPQEKTPGWMKILHAYRNGLTELQ